MFKQDLSIVWTLGFLSLAVLIWAGWNDYEPEYKHYQREFAQLVEEKLGPDKAAAVPKGVQQIWVREANRVDRCTSCHLGVTWTGLEDAKEPFRTHSPEMLKTHPIEKFGCTFCHGGQGSATKKEDAHGWIKHWKEPLLDSTLASDRQVKDPWAFVEIRCNYCHRYDRQVEGMPHINNAKELVNKKGCRGCHTINQRGGNIGPDLTDIADKHAEQYNYERLTNEHTIFNWQVAHLMDPKAFTKDTVMPNFGFTSENAKDVTLLLMSWKNNNIPVSLMPGIVLKDVPTVEEAERERIMREGEGKFFVEKTCFICHDVSSLGIQSATKIGPDLALAVDDVPRRFGRTLEDFLQKPTGTMELVLSKQILLTPEERAEAAKLLRVAFEKHKEQKAKAALQSAPSSNDAKPGEGAAKSPSH